MIFLKKYYVPTTAALDCVPITHELHYAIRDAALQDGLITVVIPEEGAALLVAEMIPEVLEAVKTLCQQWSAVGGDNIVKDRRQQPVAIATRLPAMCLGNTLQLPFAKGKLCLNPYRDVVVCDTEAKVQRREIVIQVFGESPPEEKPRGARRG